MIETAHFYVYGRVQGVGFRFWTVQTASRLGLEGWVRNRRNGSVEVYAVGSAVAVEKLREACMKGPLWSQPVRIEAVTVPNANIPSVQSSFFREEATV